MSHLAGLAGRPTLMISPLLLPLNDTTIVVVNPQDKNPYAVQITVKTKLQTVTVGILAAYFIAQKEISTLILSLASAYTQSKPPRQMEFEGNGYILVATRKRWTYGRDKLRLMMGDEDLKPCKHKWTFVFEING